MWSWPPIARLFRKRASSVPQPAGLISVLLDRSAPLGDRDDAALGLGYHDEPEAEAALLPVAADPQTDDVLLDTCGYALAQIWCRKGRLDPETVRKLQPAARTTAVLYIEQVKPEWRSLIRDG